MAPTIFGIEHIIYLIIFTIFFITLVIIMKKYCKTKCQKNLLLNIVASTLLISIILNRIAISIRNDELMRLIPDSFCGVTSFLLSLCVLTIKDKNHPVFNVFVPAGFIGGLIVTIYPDFIGQSNSFFYPSTITGLLHHTLSMMLVTLLFVSKKYCPRLKNWWHLPVGLSIYMTWGIFLIDALGFNKAMLIGAPLIADSIFTWYFVGLLLIILQITFLYIYENINKKFVLSK